MASPDPAPAERRSRLHHPLAIVGIPIAWVGFLLGVGELSHAAFHDLYDPSSSSTFNAPPPQTSRPFGPPPGYKQGFDYPPGPTPGDPLGAFHGSASMAAHFPGFRGESLYRIGNALPPLEIGEKAAVMGRLAEAAPDLMRTDWSESKVVARPHSLQGGDTVKVVRLGFVDRPADPPPGWQPYTRWAERAFVFAQPRAAPTDLLDVIDLDTGESLADLAVVFAADVVKARPFTPPTRGVREAAVLLEYVEALRPAPNELRPDWAALSRRRDAARAKFNDFILPTTRAIAARFELRAGIADATARRDTAVRLQQGYPLDPYAARSVLMESASGQDAVAVTKLYEEYVARFGPPQRASEPLIRHLANPDGSGAARCVREAIAARPGEAYQLETLRRVVSDRPAVWAGEVRVFLASGEPWSKWQEDNLFRDKVPAQIEAFAGLIPALDEASRPRARLRVMVATGRWDELAAAMRASPPRFGSDAEGVGPTLALDLFAAGELTGRLSLFPAGTWPALAETVYGRWFGDDEFDGETPDGKSQERWKQFAALVAAIKAGSPSVGRDVRVRYFEAAAKLSAKEFAVAAALLKPLRRENGLEDYSPANDYLRAMAGAGKGPEAYREADDKEQAFNMLYVWAAPAGRVPLIDARLPDVAGSEKAYLVGTRHALKGDHKAAIIALTPVSPLGGPAPQPIVRQHAIATTLFDSFAALEDWAGYDRLTQAIRRYQERTRGDAPDQPQRYYPYPDAADGRKFVLRRASADLMKLMAGAEQPGSIAGDLWNRDELRATLRSPEFAAFREKYPEKTFVGGGDRE